MYQGLGRADLRGLVDQLHDLMIGREPDVTVLIDIAPDVGLGRALSRGGGEERFESFGEGSAGADARRVSGLAEEFDERFVVIDGGRAVEAVAGDVAHAVEARLP